MLRGQEVVHAMTQRAVIPPKYFPGVTVTTTQHRNPWCPSLQCNELSAIRKLEFGIDPGPQQTVGSVTFSSFIKLGTGR